MFQSDYLTIPEIDHMFRQALHHLELQRLATHIDVLCGAPDNGQLALAEAALARLKAAYQAAVPAGVPCIEGELVDAPVIEGELVAPVDAPVIGGEWVTPAE